MWKNWCFYMIILPLLAVYSYKCGRIIIRPLLFYVPDFVSYNLNVEGMVVYMIFLPLLASNFLNVEKLAYFINISFK